jgi:hypothetical protein
MATPYVIDGHYQALDGLEYLGRNLLIQQARIGEKLPAVAILPW